MQHTRVPSRSAGIVIHQNQLLVMQRTKNNLQYYTFPGGTVEMGETPEHAAVREILEETSVQVNIHRLLYQLDIINKQHTKQEYFYLVEYRSGTPTLPKDSIEFLRSNKTNLYQPMWIPLEQLPALKLYPLEIKNRLLNDLQHGFDQSVYHLSVKQSELQS